LPNKTNWIRPWSIKKRNPSRAPSSVTSGSICSAALGYGLIVLPLAGYYRRSTKAICAFTLALVATTCISALVPAIGVYGMLACTPAIFPTSDFPNIEPQGYYDTLHDAPPVRAGTLHGLNLSRLVGILTFPSFHAASAALYIWAFSPLRWLRLLLVPCNILMIAASPVGGGHYFVDVFAGIAVSAAAIVVTLRISYMHPRFSPRRCRAARLADARRSLQQSRRYQAKILAMRPQRRHQISMPWSN
jgi:hypothetical protein